MAEGGRGSLRTYLAERYQPPLGRGRVWQPSDLPLRIRGQVVGGRAPVTHLCSIYVPADETCFFLFESESGTALEEASRRAGAAFERVEEVVLYLPMDAPWSGAAVSDSLVTRGTTRRASTSDVTG